MWENTVELLLFYKEQQSVSTYYTYLPPGHARNQNSGEKFENFETYLGFPQNAFQLQK
jgi:hypothetical protein